MGVINFTWFNVSIVIVWIIFVSCQMIRFARSKDFNNVNLVFPFWIAGAIFLSMHLIVNESEQKFHFMVNALLTYLRRAHSTRKL